MSDGQRPDPSCLIILLDGRSESDPLGTSLNETTDLFFLLALKQGLGRENGGFGPMDLVCVCVGGFGLLFLERF